MPKKSAQCNEKCMTHTVVETGESAKFIQGLLDWQSNFIADKIRSGNLESVRIPHFGIFRPKMGMVRSRGYGTRPTTTVRRPKEEENND